jgi:hypothetical protein
LAVVELATMAFLVVLRLLISDFFWMVMVRSSRIDFEFRLCDALLLVHDAFQTWRTFVEDFKGLILGNLASASRLRRENHKG